MNAAIPFSAQLINLFAAVILLLAFAMLAQRRLPALINLSAKAGSRNVLLEWNPTNDANFADQVAKWSQEPKMPRKLLVDDSSDLSESDSEPVDSEQGYETATVKDTDTDTDTDTDNSDGVGVADNANAAENKVSYPLLSHISRGDC